MQYFWTFKTFTCVLKLKWSTTSEQETISSWPSQKFGCLPRNLKTGAGLSTVPGRQLHLDTTLHGNAQDKPRKTGWTDVINWGGARFSEWSMLSDAPKKFLWVRQYNMQAIWKAYFSYTNRSHGNSHSLVPGSSSCLLFFFWEGMATTHWSFPP